MTPLEIAAVLVGFGVLALALPPAILLLATGRRNLLGMTGALYLVLVGIIDASYAVGLLASDATVAATASYYTAVGFFILPFSYFAFAGQAIPSPLVRPFRRRGVLILLALCGLGILAVCVAVPDQIATAAPEDPAGIRLSAAAGYLYYFASIAATYGVVAAWNAFVRSPKGSVTRTRTRLYLIAFGLNDLGVVWILVEYQLYTQFQLFSREFTFFVYGVGSVVLQMAGLAVLIWAMLRWQLLGIELKMKRSLARGTVAGVFVGAFFVVSAIAEQYLQQYGYLAGGVAVGLLLFVFVPIQRAASRLADRVFPGVSDDPDYLMRMKVDFYRQALEDAMATTGAPDPARTDTLRKLRASIGLTQRDHEMILASLSGGALAHRPRNVVPGATVLGKYKVERELGSGGGGHAFLAQDVRMNRSVVLKRLPGGDQAAAIREARAIGAIEHPNVVRIYDVEDLGAESLLVMEYVDGGSLKERIAASGALSKPAFARVADDMLRALEAVHATGAIHRDIKPSNVLLTRDGRAKLADFGIARLPGFETTVGGAPAGTVQYMSPEQARGKHVTASSDLYSAAATIYEAYSGHAVVEPLPGESVMEMQMRVGQGHRFTRKVTPPTLGAWFARALSPANRFGSAAQMRKTLAAALRAR